MPETKICNLSFDELKELIDIVHEKKLYKFLMKSSGGELVIETHKDTVITPAVPVNAAANGSSANSTPENAADTGILEIKAPIIGTFYAAPSPDAPPFVTVGQSVKKGDTVMIIESMKLMNEIQCDFDGTVKEILVKNGESVEFDQTVITVMPIR
ncbi:MAG: acetyl-CoA carboxylase biotin carboxyl carrier protein [Oscillospiraceae bacterium]|jgi:acetyl-CoA carboxylase biotin carboxyl carrier protein|nr:acetyl-CoA carboxylase biotin carboxyl carrier protein [Oscillospiraceae bacterium]